MHRPVCCIQETPIRDSSNVIRLTFLPSHSVKFHPRSLGGPKAAAFSVADGGMVSSERTKAALLA